MVRTLTDSRPATCWLVSRSGLFFGSVFVIDMFGLPHSLSRVAGTGYTSQVYSISVDGALQEEIEAWQREATTGREVPRKRINGLC